MGVETIGKAGISAAGPRGREDGPRRGQAVSAPIAASLILKSSCARAAGLSRCRGSKAA
jgi:hypothetical protein